MSDKTKANGKRQRDGDDDVSVDKKKKGKSKGKKEKKEPEGPIVTHHGWCSCPDCQSDIKLKDVESDKRLETEEDVKQDVVRIRKLMPLLAKPTISYCGELLCEALSKATDMVANEFVMSCLNTSGVATEDLVHGNMLPAVSHYQWCLRTAKDEEDKEKCAEDTPIGLCLRLLAAEKHLMKDCEILAGESYSDWNECRIQVVKWLKNKYKDAEQYVTRILLVLEIEDPKSHRLFAPYVQLAEQIWSSSLESVKDEEEDDEEDEE